MPRKLTVGSCFSGIGGIEKGLEDTGGFETKWQIENDPYASAVLAKHWPNVKRYSDIRDVSFPERVDVICGGFPCQDVSLAGTRAGLEGKRSTLWNELFRLVCEVGPRWLVAENVPGLLSSDDGRFFGNILRDLASIGFDAEWGVLSAAGVGAPHLRRRVFILANATSEQDWRQEQRRIQSDARASGSMADSSVNQGRFIDRDSEENVSDASCELLNGSRTAGNRRAEFADGNWWAAEPDMGRVAHGVPSRVDRLKCLGNAVVPQVAEKVGRMILNIADAALLEGEKKS